MKRDLHFEHGDFQLGNVYHIDQYEEGFALRAQKEIFKLPMYIALTNVERDLHFEHRDLQRANVYRIDQCGEGFAL